MAAVAVSHTASSAGEIRRALASSLGSRGLRESSIDDAELVMSELMGNAVRHARPLADGSVRAQWGFYDHRLRLAVTDGGSMTEPRPRPADTESTVGRGLAIVAALAADWGVVDESDRCTVWADLDLPA
jgi:serine/threonine-protein kinase RsbW